MELATVYLITRGTPANMVLLQFDIQANSIVVTQYSIISTLNTALNSCSNGAGDCDEGEVCLGQYSHPSELPYPFRLENYLTCGKIYRNVHE